MKRIQKVEDHLTKLQPKLKINASDWSKDEKLAIEECYFEITKVSVGRGRTLDLGCPECVQSAVNIIKNYQALVERAEASEPEPAEPDWRQSAKTIKARAKELGLTLKSKKNAEMIAEIEVYLATQEEEEEEEEEEDDLLGSDEDFTKEQLAKIISSKTGEEVDPEEYTHEELLEAVKSLEDGTDEE